MALTPITKSILSSVAPTLLAALTLPPPFNIIAAAVVSGALSTGLSPTAPTPAPAPAPAPADTTDTTDTKTDQTPPTITPKQPANSTNTTLTPAEIITLVENNSKNPDFLLKLRSAEADLRKYEIDAGIRFAELELEDRTRAGDFQRDTGLAGKVFSAGMWLVAFSLTGLLVVVIGALILVFTGAVIPTDKANVVTAAFGLIGTAVGFINGISANIVGFYWGSSQGSKDKGDQIAQTVQNLSEQIGKSTSNPPPPSNQPTATATTDNFSAPSSPTAPANVDILEQVISQLTTPHKHFPQGVSWALTSKGVSVEGAPAMGTAGEPTTVRAIWDRYGELCSQYAKQYGVPVELIVATIAAESGGNPTARRQEPKIGDESVGLMQTLVKTAQGVLGRNISGDQLLSPELSIEAGTACIAKKLGNTHFDPPMVAAAYNAGSIIFDDGELNRWKLLCYPTGTGQHIDRYVAFFSDCMRVNTAGEWTIGSGVPNFVTALAKKGLDE